MYVRAFIVVLAVLNVGVALWWALWPQNLVPSAPTATDGVASLQLVAARESPAVQVPDVADAAQLPAAVQEPEHVPQPAAVQVAAALVPSAESAAPMASSRRPVQESPVPGRERCLSVGPYPARNEAHNALGRAKSQVTRASIREVTDVSASSYRVILPSVGNRAAAEALIKRITEAGLVDYYVITRGDEHDVALGRYRSRERAERRRAELAVAGFEAKLVADSGATQWWIDLTTSQPIAGLRQKFSAAQQRSLNCSALR